MPTAPDSNNSLKKSIFGDENHGGNLKEIIPRIAKRFLIKESDMEKKLEKIGKENWLIDSIGAKTIVTDGIPLTVLLSDKDYHKKLLQLFTSQHLERQAISLRIVMEELRERFLSERVIECFNDTGFFNKKEDMPHLKKAFSEYWKKDYGCASYFFCSLIETAVRALVKRETDQPILKFSQHGRDVYYSLNEFLQESIFSKINRKIYFYLRVVLVELLGMNLRNELAHGINKQKLGQRATSDRLLHVMMVLLLVSTDKNRK